MMQTTLKTLLVAAVSANTENAAMPNVDELMKDMPDMDLENLDKDKMQDALKNLTESLGQMGKDGEGMPDLEKLLGGEGGLDMEKLMQSLGGAEGLKGMFGGEGESESGESKEVDSKGEDDEDDADFDQMDQEEQMKQFENEPAEAPLEPQLSATAQHILVETEEEAAKLIEEIGESADKFEEKAKEVSKCPSGKEGGMLGSFGRGQMVPEFDEAVFAEATEVGKVHSAPVKTSFGYHVLRVSNRGKASMARASHILVKTEEKANELKEKIANDKVTFMKTALKESDCPSGKQGGKLGEFSKGQMVPEFETAVFSEVTTIGEVVGPIKTSFGYHLLLVTDRVEAGEEKATEEKATEEKAEVKEEL